MGVFPSRYIIKRIKSILIFFSENKEKGWDGRTYSGNIAEKGVYSYRIIVKDHKKERQLKLSCLIDFF